MERDGCCLSRSVGVWDGFTCSVHHSVCVFLLPGEAGRAAGYRLPSPGTKIYRAGGGARISVPRRWHGPGAAVNPAETGLAWRDRPAAAAGTGPDRGGATVRRQVALSARQRAAALPPPEGGCVCGGVAGPRWASPPLPSAFNLLFLLFLIPPPLLRVETGTVSRVSWCHGWEGGGRGSRVSPVPRGRCRPRGAGGVGGAPNEMRWRRGPVSVVANERRRRRINYGGGRDGQVLCGAAER